MIVRGRLVYGPPMPVGNRPVVGAEVALFDADLPPGGQGDDFIARTTTDADGEFRFDFDFDAAHGNDPPTVTVWGRTFAGVDALRPYIQVKLHGVEEGIGHPVVPEIQVPPGSPSPRIPVRWAPPRVCLPQDQDPLDQALRAARLALESAPYQWKRFAHIPGAPEVAFDPPIWMLEPLTDGLYQVDDIALPVLEINGLLNRAPGGGDSYLAERDAETQRIRTERDLSRHRDFSLPDTYRTMFGDLGAPESVRRVPLDGDMPDAWFAEQRLIGLNPMKICRLGSKMGGSPPPGFAPHPTRVRNLTGWTWEQLAEQGRLYVCDYTMLHDVAHKYAQPGRYLPAPYAVFYRTHPRNTARRSGPGRGHDLFTRAQPELMPLCIRTRPDGPVYLPGDGDEWAFAKMQVQVADVNLHEMAYHLWGCHIAMEPFAVAAARTLATTHPLRELFRRHFFGLLWINQYGLRHLLNFSPDADGRAPVKDFLAPSFTGSMEIIRLGRPLWSIAKKSLARDLRERGMDDPAQSLKSYPYRDDGLKLWKAMEGFVGEYLDLYYDEARDVRDDHELTGFYKELRDHDVPDIGRPDNANRAQNLTDLKEQVTQILWVSTALHNLLNAPQYAMAGFAGNMPTASNMDPAGPAPTRPYEVYVQGSGPDDNSQQRAMGMMGLTAELSLYNPDGKAGGLGHYRWWGDWMDGNVEPIVQRFRERLAEVDAEIEADNASRALQWHWMRPSTMANSTST